MDTTFKHCTRALTNDEVIAINDKGGVSRDFRVRIWRGFDATSIVVVTLPESQDLSIHYVNPSVMSSKIANHVNSQMLGFPPTGFLYFESDPCVGETFEFVEFTSFGSCGDRARLFDPTRITFPWDRLEFILQTEIQR